MRSIRFGIAGLKDPKDLEGSVAALKGAGYEACEVQFVKEFTLKEPEAKRLGEIAQESGLALSVHAPYFAQLTTKEPDRLKLHLGALHHCCKLAGLMGATVVVCHPGSHHNHSPDELHERVDKALTDLGPRIEDTGVKLGLETCGRRSQFGALGDIALLVRKHPFTTPVIDYAHIHALSNGSLKDAAALEALFAYIVDQFSAEHLRPLHTHFSDNEFGPAGEIRHIPYGTGTLRIANVLKGAERFDLDLTVISEEKWPESHEAILDEIRKTPLALTKAAPAPKDGIWFPFAIPLEKSKDAHRFVHGSREVRITNLDKVFFPDEGIKKGDLINYYYNVGPLMLPFLRDRPITMQRVPDGIYGEAFYEKQAPKGSPDWLRTIPVSFDGGTKHIDFIVVDDVPALVWLAQIASVEVHAWTAKAPDLDQPDFAVMDLDPHEPVEFDDVRAVASLVQVLLERLGLRGFPKTSGGSGLQVFVPLVPGHSYQEVREFCSGLGRLMVAAYPEKVTMAPSKAQRAGKIYVDAGQNAKGQTLVAPYSVRPYPGAPVSAPLAWDEVADEFHPHDFTIATMFARIEQRGDLFRGAMMAKQDLHPAIEKLKGE